MENQENINPTELIKAGRRQLANGNRPIDVFKFIRSKVDDPELRAQIMEQINGRKSFPEKRVEKKEPARFKSKKHPKSELRKAKYAVEDFWEAIGKLNGTGILLIGMGLIFGLFAAIFEVPNWGNVAFSIVSGLAMMMIVRSQINWEESNNIYASLGIFSASIFIELMIFGIPYALIPGIFFVVSNKIIGLIALAISASPIVYVVIRFATLYPFISMIFRKNEMERFSPMIRNRAKQELKKESF